MDELSADDAAAADAELNEPNGPIVLNADDIKLVIPRRKKGQRIDCRTCIIKKRKHEIRSN